MMCPLAAIGVLAISVFLSPLRANAADFVVFSVKGDVEADGYPVMAGMQLDAGSKIAVPSAGELTLFGNMGKVIAPPGFAGSLTPAHEVTTPATGSSSVTPWIWKLLISAITFANDRGPPVALNHDGWAFPLNSPGKKCVARGRSPLIGVDPSLLYQSATILDVDSSEQASLFLGSPTVDWPPSLPVNFRAEYQASIGSLRKIIAFRLVEVDAGPDMTLTDLTLRHLASAHCDDQLLQFAAMVAPSVILGK